MPAFCLSSLQTNSLPSHALPASSPVASPTLLAPGKGGRQTMYFSNATSLLRDWKYQAYKVAAACVHLVLDGRQGSGELLQVREEKETRGGQKGATRQIMSVLPCPPNSHCYRLGKKERRSCELKKKHRETSQYLSCPTHRTTVCISLPSPPGEHRESVVSQHRTSQFVFLLQENQVSAAMWKGLIGSFEVILVTKLINNLMPIIHFNHSRWHLLPELQSIFTTAALLKVQ